jgi:hypothetical protein
MVSPIEQIEALNKRLENAMKLFESCKVHTILNMPDHYAVESGKAGAFWMVNGSCGCPDATERTDLHKGWCKHKLAVELFKEAQAKAATEEKPKGKSKPTPEELKESIEGLYPPDKEAA